MSSNNLSTTIESFFSDTQRRVAKPAGKHLGTGQVHASHIKMALTADDKAMQVSQLLYGECYDYYFEEGLAQGWFLSQSRRDQYVGYINTDDIITPSFASNAKIAKLSTSVYQSPSLKSPVVRQLPLGAQLQVDPTFPFNAHTSKSSAEYIYSPPLKGWVYKGHLQFDHQPRDNPVQIARQFIGQSYLWGARSGWACDCSSLVQLCYELCGCSLPRDTHLQCLYTPAFEKEAIAVEHIQAADLIFWAGHVAIASSNSHLIHATCVGMHVIEEPIEQVIQRMLIDRGQPVLTVLRPKLG